MNEQHLNLVVGNILGICNVKVKTPVMLDDLRKYIVELEKNILKGKL